MKYLLLVLLVLLAVETNAQRECRYTRYTYGPCSKPCGGGSHTGTRTAQCTSAFCKRTCTQLTVTRQCNIDPCPPPACAYSKWGSWSTCTAPCDGGKQTRTRQLTAGTTTACPLPLTQTRVCNIDPCPPKGCTYNPWGNWGACSVPCGGGTKSRSRTLKTGVKANCPDTTQTRKCNIDPCPCTNPADPRCCTFNKWSSWSACSKPCDGGSHSRTRTLAKGDPKICVPTTQKRLCNLDPCPPGQCEYNKWGAWSQCTVPCGGGTQNRARTVNVCVPKAGLPKCPDPKTCTDGKQQRSCNLDPCPKCVADKWGAWSPCSKPCDGGTQSRSRPMVQPVPPGATCPPASVTRKCNIDPCPKCLYGKWTTWSQCTVPCGGGTHFRTRTAVNNVGGNCPPQRAQRACNLDPCPPPPDCSDPKNAGQCCKMGPWSNWNACSVPCGGGTHTRTRKVLTGAGLKACIPTTQTRQCNLDPCPCAQNDPRPQCQGVCTYGPWSKWSQCTQPCDGGLMSRTRSVIKGDANKCPRLKDDRTCNLDPCPKPKACTYGPWSKWAQCSKPCGGGTHFRTRIVQKGTPQQCPDQRQNRGCNIDPCPCADPKVPCNCKYGQWAPWTKCTVPCGGGSQGRSRPVISGSGCPSTQERRCNIDPCPQQGCKFGQWAPWTKCTKPCNTGTQQRTRDIASGKPDPVKCPTIQTRNCNIDPCCDPKKDPTCGPCVMGTWSKWSPCPVPCGGGTHFATLKRISGDPKQCPDKKKTRLCNIDPCPPDCTDPKNVDKCCKYAPWSNWAPCTELCGGGVHTRTRGLDQNSNVAICKHTTQSRQCNLDACPCKQGDPRPQCACKYAAWAPWSPCSRPCDGGLMTRSRPGTGAQCPPQQVQRLCNLDPCPKDPGCKYGVWSSWGPCSKPCGGGTHFRVRVILQGDPTKCPDQRQNRLCNIDDCPCTDPKKPCSCTYGTWEKWSPCTVTCGGGSQSRTRPLGTGQKKQDCPGWKVNRQCNLDPCTCVGPNCCVYTPWQKWGRCTKECNGGTHTRSRTLTSGSQTSCKLLQETRVCNLDPCCPVGQVCCEFGPWQPWSKCTVPCNGGTQSRMRNKILGPATCNGKTQRPCNIDPCPNVCTYKEWTNWSPCTEQCGGGTQTRTRGPQDTVADKSKCPPSTEQRQCNMDACNKCTLGPWNKWTKCTQPCNGGTQQRTRTATGTDTSKCTPTIDSRICNIGPCPNCDAGNWGQWGPCSKTCDGGYQTRTCTGCGSSCPSSARRVCNVDPCCDTSNNPWGKWSKCTESCNGGTQTRFRNVPAGMPNCAPKATRVCNIDPCPTCADSYPWGPWGTCSKQCNGGIQTSQRQVPSGSKCPDTRRRECNLDPCLCEGNPWSLWTPCSKDCGGGSQQRTRTDTNNNKVCSTQQRSCNMEPCCESSPWQVWGPCSQQCGGGTQKRTRGKNIPGCKSEESRVCNIDPCCKDPATCCKYTPWGKWGACTEACGGGKQWRTRVFLSGPGAACKNDTDVRPCNIDTCCKGQDCCVMTQWGPFGKCSSECGGGTHTRTRTRTSGPANCPSTDSRPCNMAKCCTKGDQSCCQYGPWSGFGKCSKTCGNGTKQRTRILSSPGPAWCDKTSDSAPCNTDGCCDVGPWGPWSTCPVTCGGGLMTSTRPITVGKAGPSCPALKRTQPCATKNCCANNVYTKWSAWSPCTKKCGGGLQSRTRTAPGNGHCTDVKQQQPCNTDVCCLYSDTWVPAGPCSAPCGPGTQPMKRSIFRGDPLRCTNTTKTGPCNNKVCCAYGQWDSWGPCDAPCGSGSMSRTRPVSTGNQKDCPDVKQSKGCNTNPCCKYDVWQPWTQCTTTCGPGTQNRFRMPIPATPQMLKACPKQLENQPCGANKPCCTYGSWQPWAPCAQSCGGGVTNSMRPIVNGDSSYCKDTKKTQPCATHDCCSYEPWGPWGPCSATCDGGSTARTRKIKTGKASYCPLTGQKENCNTKRCCSYSGWSPWAPCTGSCGGGTTQSTRSLLTGSFSYCPNPTRTKPCPPHPCCEYDTEWGAWGQCTSTCGAGTMSRTRTAKSGSPTSCPTKQDQPCNIKNCCSYGTWGPWSPCDQSCGGGNRNRQRVLLTGLPSYCKNSTDTGTCAAHACCSYGPWGAWNACPATCGGAVQTRTRPVATGPTDTCKKTEDRQPCATDQCCQWGPWSQWGTCSQSCSQNSTVSGIMTQSRQLLAGVAGKCGNATRSKPCNPRNCCSYWDWTAWGPCSASCGKGQQTRTRAIKTGATDYCKATSDSQPCSAGACCQYANWAAWGPCTEVCGPDGKQIATRAVTLGGSKCNDVTKSQPCNTEKPCPCANAQIGQWSSWSPCSDYCYGETWRTRTVTVNGQSVTNDPKCPATKAVKDCNTCCGDPSCAGPSPDQCVGFCQNGGKCNMVSGKPECTCPHLFTGAKCENKTTGLDPCGNWTCYQNGRCFVTYEGVPTCYCDKPFYGPHCHEVDPCSINPCQHGGSCTTKFEKAICKCTGKWMGEFCDKNQDTLCNPNPCNKGTCTPKWGAAICDCPTNTYGDKCQNSGTGPPPTPCDTNKLAGCTNEGSKKIDASTKAGKCKFDAWLAKCATETNCGQRLGVWCKSFFSKDCMPKECASSQSSCRDQVYQVCYHNVESSKNNFPSQCDWEQALVQCTIDSGCTNLQKLVCTHANTICKEASKTIDPKKCPSSMLQTSLLEGLSTSHLSPEAVQKFRNTFFIGLDEHKDFFREKEQKAAENAKTMLIISAAVVVAVVALVALAVALRRKEQPHQAVHEAERKGLLSY